MAEHGQAPDPGPVPSARLAKFLREHAPDYGGPFVAERVGEGNSCLTYMVTGADGWQVVLRRPPRGDLPATAYDVAREYRIMSAIHAAGSPVPVPRPIVLCQDPDVLGAPFYLVEVVDGLVLRLIAPPGFDEDARRIASASLVDTLVDLHAVPWNEIGLADYGKPAGYAERQLARMERIWERAQFRPLPDVDALAIWLRANLPPAGPPAIVHGDYRLDNVILSPTGPPRVAAVVDWELSTIGDPLADLGWLLYYWLDEETETGWPGMPAIMTAEGFFNRAEVLGRYLARRPETAPEHVSWYAALAGWKTAIMLEGSYRRFVEGTSDHQSFAALELGIPYLARRALDIAESRLEL
jgi:aminoglycoside phosphotransferase (APT) family kinase protein